MICPCCLGETENVQPTGVDICNECLKRLQMKAETYPELEKLLGEEEKDGRPT
jgi:hypothetical protein